MDGEEQENNLALGPQPSFFARRVVGTYKRAGG